MWLRILLAIVVVQVALLAYLNQQVSYFEGQNEALRNTVEIQREGMKQTQEFLLSQGQRDQNTQTAIEYIVNDEEFANADDRLPRALTDLLECLRQDACDPRSLADALPDK